MPRKAGSLRSFALVVALTGLAFVTTLVIRIPIPATTGYFNIGDVFVLLGALWLGPRAGIIIGAIGPTLADAIGYPQFVLATLTVKGVEGLLAGLVASRRERASWKLGGAYTGATIMVLGYFTFEAFIYPALGKWIPFLSVTNVGAALVEMPLNAFQGFVGATVALGLWRAVKGMGTVPETQPDAASSD